MQTALPQTGPAEDATGATADEPEAIGEPATVTRVIDGDTVEVRFKGESLDGRLIGIDTPETVDPSEPVGCYGPAASRFTTKMLEGEDVRLEFDVERTDRYGRTLAYVWLGDELFNETLVARGFATVTTYPPNVRYVDRFLAAQRDAPEPRARTLGSCLQRARATGHRGRRRRRRRRRLRSVLPHRLHPSVPAGS
jgi:micrococcal nuclease